MTKFKVGDEVIGNDNASKYTITNRGWKGVVTAVHSESCIDVRRLGDPESTCFTLDANAFDLIKQPIENEAVEL